MLADTWLRIHELSSDVGLDHHKFGFIAPGAAADLVVLDAELMVVQTYVAGQLVYSKPGIS